MRGEKFGSGLSDLIARGNLGAACARGMALRALSYNKFGVRRPYIDRVHKPQNREQNLHVNAVPVVEAFVAAAL